MNTLFEAIGGFLSAGRTRRFFRAKVEVSEGPWRARARAVREIVIASQLGIAEQRCRRLLGAMGEERPTETESHVVEVVTASNWRTSGTVIRVQLAPVPEGTKIAIAAWPGAQLFDWGESRRAVRHVADVLRVQS